MQVWNLSVLNLSVESVELAFSLFTDILHSNQLASAVARCHYELTIKASRIMKKNIDIDNVQNMFAVICNIYLHNVLCKHPDYW